jgi:hypothetical protein
MLELVITVCLLSNPNFCRDQKILMDQPISPFQCIMQAQGSIAEWGSSHPKWFVQRWTCRNQTKEKEI